MNSASPSSAHVPSLEVRVRRRLGNFTLDVAFDVPAPPDPRDRSGAGERGAITALVGPSGAGKTLTLRAVAGLLRPDTGRIVCAGRVLFEAAAERSPRVDLPARARNVGVVFQQGALFPHLTVAGNVAYGLHGRPRAARDARVAEVLGLVGLSGHAGRRPDALSGGEQQRVALARALAPGPALLLLDEPFAALDAPLRSRLGDALRAVHFEARVPVLLITHDLTEACRVADAMVRLDAGQVVAIGGPTREPRA